MFILYKRIELGYIQKTFEELDIERAILDANTFFIDSNFRIEKIIQNLLNFFIDNPPNELYKYTLTSHTDRFIQFIGKKLFNEHTHFPLRKTFQNYGIFKASEITNIGDFESWYEFNFKNASKSNIEDHLESFKDLVNNSVYKLNQLANSKKETRLESLDTFVTVFKKITSKADEIREILVLSGVLKSEIRNVIQGFENKISSFPSSQKQEDQDIYELLEKDYNKAKIIKNEVTLFFNLVDNTLEKIIERSLYANQQLSLFKENFRTRSTFQLNLRRFLEFSLKSVEYQNENNIVFNTNYPARSILSNKRKFISPKFYSDFKEKRNFVQLVDRNEDYLKDKLQVANSKLLKQEKISKLILELQNQLTIERSLNLTNCFYNILHEFNDTEIALKVVHYLLEYYSINSDYTIDIKKTIDQHLLHEKILLWRIKIKKS